MVEKNLVAEVIKTNDLCVLSTVNSDGRSQSAVMAYTPWKENILLMNTEATTKKLKNIQTNPYVSVTIGGLKGDPALQLEGTASILAGTDEVVAKKYMLSVNPKLADYFSPTGKFVAITYTWVRFSDFSSNPPQILEFTY